MKRPYDSTVARIAGNILSGMVNTRECPTESDADNLVFVAVTLARRVVAECERTEPAQSTNAIDPNAQPSGKPTPRDSTS